MTGVSAATMELAHCRCPPLLNAPQMGDKRRRPILPTKRDTAEISRARRQKRRKIQERERKKGSGYREVGKSISRGPTSEQEFRDSCGKTWNAFL